MNLFVRNLRYWIPVSLWLIVIALESLFLSSNVTGSWLWEIARGLHIPISWETFSRFHHMLRKAGHVTGYGILCILIFRAWYHTLREAKASAAVPQPAGSPISGLRVRCTSLALVMTLITAILDEWHQSFDPTRTGSVRDVGLDVIGGVIFLSIALFVLRLWREMPARELETASA